MDGPGAVTGKSGLTRQAAAYGLGLMTLLNFVNYIDRYVLPAVAPRIKEALSTHRHAARVPRQRVPVLLFHDARAAVRLARRPALAHAADGARRGHLEPGHRGRRPGPQLRADARRARGAVGVGEASYAAISPALISDYYPPERRGRVFAIFYLAIPVGSAVGYLLGGAARVALRLARGVLRRRAAGPAAGAAHADGARPAARHQRRAAAPRGAGRELLAHAAACSRATATT